MESRHTDTQNPKSTESMPWQSFKEKLNKYFFIQDKQEHEVVHQATIISEEQNKRVFDIECLICCSLLFDPVECENVKCCQPYCRKCVKDYTRSHGNQKQCAKKCLAGSRRRRYSMYVNKLPINRYLKNFLDEVKVQCGKCKEEMSYKQLCSKEHIEECENKEPMECPQGCGTQIWGFGEGEEHWKSSCPNSQVQCWWCMEVILRKDLQDHFQKECIKYPHYCPNTKNGCFYKSNRNEIDSHLEICRCQEIKCPQTQCTEKFLRKDYPKHYQTCKYQTVACEKCELSILRKDQGQHDCIKALKRELETQLSLKDQAVHKFQKSAIQELINDDHIIEYIENSDSLLKICKQDSYFMCKKCNQLMIHESNTKNCQNKKCPSNKITIQLASANCTNSGSKDSHKSIKSKRQRKIAEKDSKYQTINITMSEPVN